MEDTAVELDIKKEKVINAGLAQWESNRLVSGRSSVRIRHPAPYDPWVGR